MCRIYCTNKDYKDAYGAVHVKGDINVKNEWVGLGIF